MWLGRRVSRAALAVSLTCLAGPASAGGFDLFTQDISLLFDPADIVVDATAAFVGSDWHYAIISGEPERVPLTGDLWVGAVGIKAALGDSAACLLSGSKPFGSNIDHGPDWSQADVIERQVLGVSEVAITCSLKASLESGYLYGIVGASRDLLEFVQTAVSPDASGELIRTRLSLESASSSWRGGLAYVERATGFAVALTYFAPIEFDLDGTFRNIPLGGGRFLSPVPVEGDVAMPAAVLVNARVPIESGWVAGIDVKWMDWSSLDHVPIAATASVGPVRAGDELIDLKAHFRDGITLGASLAAALGDRWTVAGRAIWDAGVSSGWTQHTSNLIFAAEARYRLDHSVELSGGLSVAWLAPGRIDKVEEGAPFNAQFDDGVALIPRVGVTWRHAPPR